MLIVVPLADGEIAESGVSPRMSGSPRPRVPGSAGGGFHRP